MRGAVLIIGLTDVIVGATEVTVGVTVTTGAGEDGTLCTTGGLVITEGAVVTISGTEIGIVSNPEESVDAEGAGLAAFPIGTIAFIGVRDVVVIFVFETDTHVVSAAIVRGPTIPQPVVNGEPPETISCTAW
jgi:hypothetical protein